MNLILLFLKKNHSYVNPPAEEKLGGQIYSLQHGQAYIKMIRLADNVGVNKFFFGDYKWKSQ